MKEQRRIYKRGQVGGRNSVSIPQVGGLNPSLGTITNKHCIMDNIKVKIKRLSENAKLPTKAHTTDAGYDLYAASTSVDKNYNIVYGTGIAVEIPDGYVGLVFPRSSIANKAIMLTNSVGVIDSGYRGEVMAKFKRVTDEFDSYQVGDRIAQLIIMPYPHVEFEEVRELSNSDRGEGGYGSSGR